VSGERWINGAIKRPGALHEELHVAKGEKIPEKKLAKAATKGGTLGRRARLAETLEHLHHDGGDHTSNQRMPRDHERQELAGHKTIANPQRAKNPHGNAGYHPSTDGYGHDSYMHTSKDR
jgi:hypothetical protein